MGQEALPIYSGLSRYPRRLRATFEVEAGKREPLLPSFSLRDRQNESARSELHRHSGDLAVGCFGVFGCAGVFRGGRRSGAVAAEQCEGIGRGGAGFGGEHPQHLVGVIRQGRGFRRSVPGLRRPGGGVARCLRMRRPHGVRPTSGGSVRSVPQVRRRAGWLGRRWGAVRYRRAGSDCFGGGGFPVTEEFPCRGSRWIQRVRFRSAAGMAGKSRAGGTPAGFRPGRRCGGPGSGRARFRRRPGAGAVRGVRSGQDRGSAGSWRSFPGGRACARVPRVQVQCPTHGIEHGTGGVDVAALFQPGVVVRADIG
jgi:hypothetical protein